MNLVLLDVTDAARNRVFRPKRFPVLIGNRRDSEVPLDREGVSRHHAGILRRDGRFYVVDLGSRNGTRLFRVQGGDLVSRPAPVAESLEGAEEAAPGAGNELRDGLYLALGECVLKCVLEPEAALARLEPEPEEAPPAGAGFRWAGIAGACMLLLTLAMLLGARSGRAARAHADARSAPAVQAVAEISRLR